MARPGIATACAMVCAVVTASASSRAQSGGVSEARASYDRGAKAYDTGDFATAAQEFALADQLAPNATVLELALKSVARVDDPVLAMTLVERADERNAQGSLADAARAARGQHGARVGQLLVSCPGACNVTIDGVAAAPGAKRWVRVGSHEVVLAPADGARESRVVQVVAESVARVEPTPRAVLAKNTPSPTMRVEPSAPSSGADGRVSPVVFWIGVGATAILGGAAIASGIDTKSRHDDFLQSPSQNGSDDGRASQIRTNVLVGATAATGVLTAALGLFAVRWSN